LKLRQAAKCKTARSQRTQLDVEIPEFRLVRALAMAKTGLSSSFVESLRAVLHLAACRSFKSGTLLGLFVFACNDQEHAKRNRSRACDDRDDDCFLLLNLELQRAQLRGVGLLGVTEATVYQSQNTCRDQQYSNDFRGAHMHLPPNV
jgi:hypothetical protein